MRFRSLHRSVRPRGRTWFPPLAWFSAYLKTLRPGDKLIALVLAGIVGITSLVSLYALERSFLVEVPTRGGSLTEGIVGSPRYINPILAISDADRDLVKLTFAGLMGPGRDGTLVPILAEKYEVSEDGTVYTFTLRENAVFSDGSPVTAEDVVFTVEKAKDPGLKSPEFANWSGIEVAAVDARTVRFTLPRPYAPFLEETALGIIPAHLWKNVTNEEFPFSPLMISPVGAGPYKVSDVRRAKDGTISSMTLTSFKNYAVGEPYLRQITAIFYDEADDLESGFAKGEVESAYGVAVAGALQAPYARTFGVFFNPSVNPLFENRSVREALSVAINRTELVDEVMGGYATALMGPLPPGSGALNAEVPVYENPTSAAADILTKAGWSYSEEERVWKDKAGTELRVNLRTSNVPELRLVAQQVQKDWAALGVPTSLELFEAGDLTKNVIRPRKYEALLFGMVIGRDLDLYAFWHSGRRNDPGLNIAGYANTQVDRLLERFRTTQDEAARLQDLATIEQQIAGDVPAAFTHAPDFVYAVPKGLRGVVLPQIASPADRFATAAYWYRHTQAVWPIFVR